MEKQLIYHIIIALIGIILLVMALRKYAHSRIQFWHALTDVKVNLQVYAPDSTGRFKVMAEFRPGKWETIIEGENAEYVMDAATELVQFGQFRIQRVYRHPVAPIAKKRPTHTPVFKEEL